MRRASILFRAFPLHTLSHISQPINMRSLPSELQGTENGISMRAMFPFCPRTSGLKAENAQRLLCPPTERIRALLFSEKIRLKKLKSMSHFPCFTARTARTALYRGFLSLREFRMSAAIIVRRLAVWIRQSQTRLQIPPKFVRQSGSPALQRSTGKLKTTF